MLAAGLADENLLMLANFDGVYLVHLDVDEWGWRNVAPGFSVSVIPTFFDWMYWVGQPATRSTRVHGMKILMKISPVYWVPGSIIPDEYCRFLSSNF